MLSLFTHETRECSDELYIKSLFVVMELEFGVSVLGQKKNRKIRR